MLTLVSKNFFFSLGKLGVIYINLTLLNPNIATKMLVSPNTFKGEKFKFKNYIFDKEED